MARIIIEMLEKTKAKIKDRAVKKSKELGRNVTLKEILLEGVGIKDE